ncbi:14823_t:CDS:2, partial [Gigaspora margarita]
IHYGIIYQGSDQPDSESEISENQAFQEAPSTIEKDLSTFVGGEQTIIPLVDMKLYA